MLVGVGAVMVATNVGATLAVALRTSAWARRMEIYDDTRLSEDVWVLSIEDYLQWLRKETLHSTGLHALPVVLKARGQR